MKKLARALLRRIGLRHVTTMTPGDEGESGRRSLDRAICDSVGGIVVADETGRILSAGAETGDLLGLSLAGDLAGRAVDDVLPAAMVEAGRAVLTCGVDTAAQRRIGEFLLARPDDSEAVIAFEATVTRPASPEPAVVVFTFRDVTTQRGIERECRRAAEAARAANASKTAFLTSMSHELRTPLNAILGFSDIIRNQSFGTVGSEYVEFAGEIHSSGRRLLEVLNDILEVTRIESGEISLEEDEMAVDAAIQSAFRAVTQQEMVATRSLSTTIEPALPALHADSRKVKSLIATLLSNAIRLTDDGGRVDASAYLSPTGELVIAVADDGAGVAPETAGGFPRMGSSTGDVAGGTYHGSSLWLVIASGHMRAHGGRLEVESAPDRGTVVRAIFPPSRVVAPADRPLLQAAVGA